MTDEPTRNDILAMDIEELENCFADSFVSDQFRLNLAQFVTQTLAQVSILELEPGIQQLLWNR